MSIIQSTQIQTISKSIDCPLMDIVNMSNIINDFTQFTPLQLAWKKFCEDQSLIDKSDLNDFTILESIKDIYSDDNIFPYQKNSEIYRKIFVSEYCDNECKKQIVNKLLDTIDFTNFFNASLCASMYGDEDSFCMENDLLNAEQDFDNYNGDENEDDFTSILKNASIIKII